MNEEFISPQSQAVLADFFRKSAIAKSDFSNDAAWAEFEQAWQNIKQLELEKQKQNCRIGVPYLATHFVGRRKEIQMLQERVANHSTVAVTATGVSSGMGKTSLVQAFIEDEANPYSMVLWTDVTPSPEPNQILRSWAQQLHHESMLTDKMSLEDISQRMREILSTKFDSSCGITPLVVLDDVWENGLETVDLIKNIFPPETKFLVTTRLDSVAEKFDTNFALDGLQTDDSVAILNSLLTNPNAVPYVDNMIAVLGNHPLTLELAASFFNDERQSEKILPILTAWQEQLSAFRPSILWGEDTPAPPSLDVVLNHIYQALPSQAKLLFQAIGVIAPELAWDGSLLAKLNPELNSENLNDDLKLLMAYRLVRLDERESQKQTWYRQHALVHQYASSILARENGTVKAFEAYTEAVLPYVVYSQTHEILNWEFILPFIPHIHHIGDELLYLHQRSIKLAKHADTFARHMMSYLEVYRNVKRREWLEMGLTANRIVSRHQEAIYQANIAMDYATRAEYDLAKDYYLQAISIFRELNDSLELARHLNSLGYVYRHQGNPELAYEHFQEALQFIREANDEKILASILNNFGGYHSQKKEFGEALAYYKQALEAARRSQEVHQAATALNNIAYVLIQEGSYQDAIPYLQESLEVTKDFGNLSSRAATLSNLGKAHFKLNNYPSAIQYYQEALEIDERSDDWWGQVFSFSNLGQVFEELNERDKALDYYRKALVAAQKIGREDFIQRIQDSINTLLG